jgi:hypothetical protein
MNEYRTRLHVHASEYAYVMTSAMWDSITSIKSIHHSSEGVATASDGFRTKGKRENFKDRIARFKIIRKAIPAHGGQKVCFQNLTTKGCSGGITTCFKAGFCHFVPKKSDIPADVLMALETTFGALRTKLVNWTVDPSGRYSDVAAVAMSLESRLALPVRWWPHLLSSTHSMVRSWSLRPPVLSSDAHSLSLKSTRRCQALGQ